SHVVVHASVCQANFPATRVCICSFLSRRLQLTCFHSRIHRPEERWETSRRSSGVSERDCIQSGLLVSSLIISGSRFLVDPVAAKSHVGRAKNESRMSQQICE